MTVSTDVEMQPESGGVRGTIFGIVMEQGTSECPLCGEPYPWVLYGNKTPDGGHIWDRCSHDVTFSIPTHDTEIQSVEVDWTLESD